MSKLPLALWQKISFSPPICSALSILFNIFIAWTDIFERVSFQLEKNQIFRCCSIFFFTTFAMQNTIGAVCLILKIFLMIEHTRFLCSFFSVLEFTCINFLFLVSLLLNSVKPECLFVGTSQAARSEYQGRTFCA